MKLTINVAAYKQPRGPHSFVTYEFAFALYAYASLVPQVFSKRGGKKGSMHYLTRFSGLLLALQMQWVVQEVILSLFILPLQFDYEGFVYDCFENGDTFPVLESLVIRNLKLSTEEPLFDTCKYTYLLKNIDIYTTLLYQ